MYTSFCMDISFHFSRSGIAGSNGVCSPLYKTARVSVRFCIPTSNIFEFLLLCTLASTWYYQHLKILAHLTRVCGRKLLTGPPMVFMPSGNSHPWIILLSLGWSNNLLLTNRVRDTNNINFPFVFLKQNDYGNSDGVLFL